VAVWQPQQEALTALPQFFSLINYKLKNKFLIKIRPFDFLAKLSNLAELHRTLTIQGKQ
jgi:hypothetical protein